MSPISEYAFSTKDEALGFQKEFGGEIHNFEETLKFTKNRLTKDNEILDEKRVPIAKKGKKIFESMCDTNNIKEFYSIGEAKQYLIDNKIASGSIKSVAGSLNKVCRNQRKSYKGLTFKDL